jgi:hypothetical protein
VSTYATPDCISDTQLLPRKGVNTGAGRAACLVHIYPSGPEMGRRYPLSAAPIRFGRGEDCDVRLADNAASRRHAEVRPAAGGHEVADLRSTNGTDGRHVATNVLYFFTAGLPYRVNVPVVHPRRCPPRLARSIRSSPYTRGRPCRPGRAVGTVRRFESLRRRLTTVTLGPD